MGLIAASCGSGKTYASVHGLPQALGVQPEETLLLVPRVSIRAQTLRSYRGQTERLTSFAEDGKVQVSTPHQIGQWFRDEPQMMPKPKLVIVDEWHTIFYENDFAEQLIYFQEQFLEWCADPQVTVVAMTATTTLPLKFVNEQPFEYLSAFFNEVRRCKVRLICQQAEPRYKVKKIFVERGTTLETVLSQIPASPHDKQLVLYRGRIEDMRELAENEEGSSWLCSRSSTKEIGGIQACDLMNQEHYQSVIKGQFPAGIDRLYVTSGYREGINIHDENVRTVVIEGVTDIDIIQTLGRVRHDIDRLIIVVDKRKILFSEKKVSYGLSLWENDDAYSRYLELLKEQKKPDYEGEKLPANLVFEHPRTQELTFNWLALCKWLYEECSCWSATTPDYKGVTFCGVTLPRSKEYFRQILSPYTDERLSFDAHVQRRLSKRAIENENARKVEEFDWQAWSGKQIIVGSEDEKSFMESINLSRLNRTADKLTSIATVKRRFPQYFGKNTRPRIEGKQYTAYNVI